MIRCAQVNDVAALHAINQVELGYEVDIEVTKEQLAKLLLRDDHMIFIAEKEGQVVGYAHAASYDCLYFPPILNLLALAIKKEVQRQGYGRKLMQALAEKGRTLGYEGMRINSGVERFDAHQFYTSLGCLKKADQKRFYWAFNEN